jgi:hypothetical protein
MTDVRDLPEPLMSGPFTRQYANTAGVSNRMLQGQRFVRVHPRVWRHRDHVMSWSDDLLAARLALQPTAALTGISRIQELGLDYGPRRPLHFVVEGELHLALEGIFLHRTVGLAPLDASADAPCIGPIGAFLAYCVRARTLDAIKVGSWMLQNGHLTREGVTELAVAHPWRDGALHSLLVVDHLDARTASLMETELVMLLRFAGLPEPEVNVAPIAGLEPPIIGDLVYRDHGVVVEYEGAHHQTDRAQYVRDIGRHSMLREHGQSYVLITKELTRTPRHAVGAVYRALVARGYTGPPPQFGDRWHSLFTPLADRITRRRRGR